MSTPVPRRLRHIVQRGHFATMLAPTYALAQSVDEEEAHERLTRAVEDPELLEQLVVALSEALASQPDATTDEDALLDRFAKALSKRASRVKEAQTTPGIAAVMVRVNLLVDLAPPAMRAALESEKGRALIANGLSALGRHLVQELLR